MAGGGRGGLQTTLSTPCIAHYVRKSDTNYVVAVVVAAAAAVVVVVVVVVVCVCV